MNYTLTVTGAALVALIALVVRASRARSPLTAAARRGLFVVAGLVALVGLLSVIQRAYPAAPGIYTTLRVLVGAALVGTMVRIVWSLR